MHHSAKDNYVHLTTTPVPRLITSLAVPTIISMLVTSFYNMADTYFVGKINTQSTAAVGIVFSVMSIIQAVGFFFGHGSGNYISRKLGAQETESAEKMASTGFFFALFIGAALAVLGLLFLTPLSLALGSTPTILPYTERYLGIILLGTPFMTASLVLNNQIRFQGNAAYAMVGIVSGAVINVVLDPILIFVCDMGISGAAALRWQFITYPLGAWIVVSNMMLQTIRKPVRATILSSARQGLFFIPLIFILPYFLGLKGVEMCQAASDMLTFFLAIPLTCGVLAEMKRKEAEQLQQRQS